MSFEWSPGCPTASAYQIRRDGEVFIGADYKKETGDNVEWTRKTFEDFCVGKIAPGAQLLDTEENVMHNVGNTHNYCIRSLIVDASTGATYVSDWSCEQVVVRWMGRVEGKILAMTGGSIGVYGTCSASKACR